MLNGAPFPDTGWFGWASGQEPQLQDPEVVANFLYWMDWPGFLTGTVNSPGVTSSVVSQTSTGTDLFGIANTAYVFQTMEVLAGSFNANDQIQFVFMVPHYLINGGTQLYGTIGYDYTSNATGVLTNFTTTNNYRVYDVTYSGPNWWNGTYRVFSNIGNLLLTIPPTGQLNDYYFRGGALI